MKLPFVFPSNDEAYRQIALVVNSLDDGHIATTSSVTLTINVTSTVVTDARCHAGSAISVSATTANAAAEIPTLYIVPTGGSFTINHANNAQADRTFTYAILG
jgi:hypothetical protein